MTSESSLRALVGSFLILVVSYFVYLHRYPLWELFKYVELILVMLILSYSVILSLAASDLCFLHLLPFCSSLTLSHLDSYPTFLPIHSRWLLGCAVSTEGLSMAFLVESNCEVDHYKNE